MLHISGWSRVSEQTKALHRRKIKTLGSILNSREVGIVLEPEVTKLKLINRVGEVWSARSPPPAADALPSSPTLPGKQSFAESPTACYKLSRYLMEAV